MFMSNEYVKETKTLKDKTDNETKLELIISIVKTRNDLQIAQKLDLIARELEDGVRTFRL